MGCAVGRCLNILVLIWSHSATHNQLLQSAVSKNCTFLTAFRVNQRGAGHWHRGDVPAWAVYFSKNWISIANIYTVAAICIVRTPHLRYRHLWRSLASASSMVDSVCFLLFVLNGSITHRARIKRTIVFWSMGWSTKSDSGLLADTIRIDEQSRNNQH